MYSFDKPCYMGVKTHLIGLRGGILILRFAKYRTDWLVREVLWVEAIDPLV